MKIQRHESIIPFAVVSCMPLSHTLPETHPVVEETCNESQLSKCKPHNIHTAIHKYMYVYTWKNTVCSTHGQAAA